MGESRTDDKTVADVTIICIGPRPSLWKASERHSVSGASQLHLRLALNPHGRSRNHGARVAAPTAKLVKGPEVVWISFALVELEPVTELIGK